MGAIFLKFKLNYKKDTHTLCTKKPMIHDKTTNRYVRSTNQPMTKAKHMLQFHNQVK